MIKKVNKKKRTTLDDFDDKTAAGRIFENRKGTGTNTDFRPAGPSYFSI
jgi:hypothetical protein